MGTLPLFGLQVVDLTDLRGALCARILADLGATVTRLDAGPPEAAVTAIHRYRNAGKRVEFVRWSADELAAAEAALASADIAVENGGLDLSRWPTLIHVALSDLGLSGPRSHWRLEALPALASSGALFATGFPDLAPQPLPGYLAHDCASVYGAAGAVAAVLDRARHGHGQRVEVSAQEAGLAGLIPWSIAIEDYLKINPLLPFEGRRNADGSYWVLPAKDGWVRVVVGTPRQWSGFVDLCGNPDALSGDEWSKAGFRTANLDVIRLVAADRLTDRTRAELFAQALGNGATIGMLHEPHEFVEHEQTKARRFFTHDGGLPLATSPFTFGGERPARREAAPRVAVALSGKQGLLLDGVRVIEFGVAAVVPEMCGVLSELGADVIKIESIRHPDVLRFTGAGNLDAGFAFNAECRGRRSITLDLTTDAGRAVAFELCAGADIVAENHRGGVLDKLGLSYDALRAVNPRLIYASSQGYGRGGPYAEMPAYGPLNSGFSGVHLLWSNPEGPYPCGASMNHPDHIAGKLLAAAVLGALHQREQAGEGVHIDMAQTEASAYLIGEIYLDRNCYDDHYTFEGVFRSKGDDDWLAICAPDVDAVLRLRGVVGGGFDFDEAVREWVAQHSSEAGAALLQAADVSAMPVMGPVAHHNDEHLRERGFIVRLEHPVVGAERHVGNPLRFSRIEQRVARSAPCLGEHTQEVLHEVLGFTPERIEALIAAGVCQ